MLDENLPCDPARESPARIKARQPRLGAAQSSSMAATDPPETRICRLISNVDQPKGVTS